VGKALSSDVEGGGAEKKYSSSLPSEDCGKKWIEGETHIVGEKRKYQVPKGGQKKEERVVTLFYVGGQKFLGER